MRNTIEYILLKKERNEKITVLTAYDRVFAPVVDAAGIDIILVGDSMANVVLGMKSTIDISFEEMLNHTRAVANSTQNALVVGDMPFCSYQNDPAVAVGYARQFMEVGCQALKYEWFERVSEVIPAVIAEGFPVMGHIGFTPQSEDKLGSSRVQGKDVEAAERLIEQARLLEEWGCFSIVLECVPWKLARLITNKLTIPTIGIGAGQYCSGQVLVIYDMLGLNKEAQFKFLRLFGNLYNNALEAIKKYKTEVVQGTFPTEQESFKITDPDLERFLLKQEQE
ncbi:MAG: 3-methyl-2-oxobutanoate hydroxymethyltransferase [Spirochaetales bacterium]|nr:3-methyl-2-oxobutanoate hydroxymethyltransferase [Spirochaetales bacterium]